jgi:hypothetical protein
MKPKPRPSLEPSELPAYPKIGLTRRLGPFLLFLAVAGLHEGLAIYAAKAWIDDGDVMRLQLCWYCAWEGALLLFLLVNHCLLGIRQIGRARLAVFWIIQASWAALGFWIYGVVLVKQPFAIQSVGGWILAAFILAVLSEGLGKKDHETEPGRTFSHRY